MRILGMVTGAVLGLSLPALAEDVPQAMMRLQDRLNSQMVESLLGSVDYEFVCGIPSYEDQVVWLEEEPAHSPEEISAALAALPAGVVLPPPPPRKTKEQLPEDLRRAALATLKSRLKPFDETGNKLYLGVRAVAEDKLHSGERLSLAESELSLAERRQLRWDTHELFRHWPIGSILFLEPVGSGALGDTAEVPVRWAFRRPGPPPFDQPEIIASGEISLSLRKVGEEWKVSHIERLIGGLRAGVVK